MNKNSSAPVKMRFSLIICTYHRPNAILGLLESVASQGEYPDQILVIDGSLDSSTEDLLSTCDYPYLEYFRVEAKDRGLTKQRNFGIEKVGKDIQIVCFLDDDTILRPKYFENLLLTYQLYPNALGVGGYISNEVEWIRKKFDKLAANEYSYDGWVRKLGSRNFLRKRVHLLSKSPPGVMPEFSNGLSISFLPPSGKIYPVEFFMGGVASFKKTIFQKIKFSSYFMGYGLYEDMDFCLRASKLGQLYVNTGAQLLHFHEDAGRPNLYEYGKMVMRNGWYVWRVKYPEPSLKARLKWHATAILLTLVRLGNTLSTAKKKEALTESLGRIAGWWSLLLNRPKHEKSR